MQNAEAGPTSWQVQIAARQHADTYIYNPQTPANEHTSRQLSALAFFNRPISAGTEFSSSFNAALRSINSNNLGRHHDVSTGMSVFVGFRSLLPVSIHAGGRIDYDPGFGLELSPQINAAYNLAAVTFRTSLAKAISSSACSKARVMTSVLGTGAEVPPAIVSSMSLVTLSLG